MSNTKKFMIVTVFGLLAAAMFIFGQISPASAQKATAPAANTAEVKANTNTAAKPADSKAIPKEFTLAKDAVEVGTVAFNHDNHASLNYSPDGKSPIACIECHHTDQPKAALQSPLVTSKRETTLTLESYKTSNQPVENCRTCHFQEGSVPDSQTQPSATYVKAGKSTTLEINNELAYHNNCNVCHDKAAAMRPEVKKNPKFATGNDCTVCHKQ